MQRFTCQMQRIRFWKNIPTLKVQNVHRHNYMQLHLCYCIIKVTFETLKYECAYANWFFVLPPRKRPGSLKGCLELNLYVLN